MSHETTKVVYTKGRAKVIRTQGYGFRCNTLTSSWHVEVNGKFLWGCTRLRDAKKIANDNA